MLSIMACVISICARFSDAEGKVLTVIQYDFRLYYYIFFVAGIIIRQYIKKQEFIGSAEGMAKKYKRSGCRISGLLMICSILTVIFIAVTLILFPYHYTILENICFFLNVPLLYIIIDVCRRKVFIKCRVLEFIGRNSMAFYLMHMFGKLVVIHIVGEVSLVPYYLLNLLLLVMEGLTIYAGTKIKLINRYVLGNVEDK